MSEQQKAERSPCPQEVLTLVEKFGQHIDAYKSGKYNETQLRREFLDPLFEALGWDMTNKTGYAEAYKDVVHEDAIKIGSETKAPDYCFRIGGTRKFFLEAKKPSVYIKEEIPPAFQLRRYAWSAKLPLSILCDFEEFSIYDTRVKPEKTDKASTARILYLTYKDYPEHWHEIATVFSREAVLKGSFDKYAETSRLKKGTATVDDAFLTEIEDWRDMLARSIALRNSNLSQRELNFAVQRTIDRIVFLRICEDRGIEDYGRLQSLLNGANAYKRLVQLFSQADDRYNSGLFHFQKEKDRHEEPDKLTPNITIDDKPLKDIIKRLYYPESPYEFSVLSADILGQVYEQFLGKVIRLTEGHQAKVEEKPEVRKAGGVYYTPKYIVDYIVKNTVGKLLEGQGSSSKGQGMTPKEAAKLRILDPACGSGSFLLGAYQYLLDWHLKWYIENDPEKWAKAKQPAVYQGPSPDPRTPNWHLTTAEKKRILLNNIYGVDIDSQAVEVTKLSLLLKVLEGENNQTLANQLRMFHERALPDLGDNIKCGNSLIGPDFYQQQTMLDDEERYRVNVFDWEKEFPEITKAGGFDAVIGNPPYIRIQTLQEWAPVEVEFYKERYSSGSKGNYDIYVIFVERGLSLLNKNGRLGYILPHKFFNAQYGQSLRELIAKGKHLAEVVHFGDQQVFAGATTYTCLLFLDNVGRDKCRFVKVEDLKKWLSTGEATEGTISAKNITGAEWNFAVGKGSVLFDKLSALPVKLGDVAERMAQGIRTSANEVYVLDLISEGRDIITAYSKHLDRNVKLERKSVSLFLQGKEIKPYRITPSGKVVIIPYKVRDARTEFISEKEMRDEFPKTFDYLKDNKAYLEDREKGKMRGSNWYAYIYPKNIDIMGTSKILVPDIADRACFAYDEQGEYAFTSGYAITLKREIAESPKYILGLLNSKVLDFYLKRISTPMRGGFFRYFTQYIERLPIRTIEFSDPADKTCHDKMVSIVDHILSLNKQLATAKTDHEKTALQRQIDAVGRQIDQLVYELYDLTEEEIKLVERV